MCARHTNDNIRLWCRDRLLVPAPVPAGHYLKTQPIVPSHLLCTTLYSGLSIVIYTIYSIPLCFWVLFTRFFIIVIFRKIMKRAYKSLQTLTRLVFTFSRLGFCKLFCFFITKHCRFAPAICEYLLPTIFLTIAYTAVFIAINFF